MPIYVSPKQWTKDKAEYARKSIARERPLVVLEYTDNIVLVTEGAPNALYHIVYDKTVDDRKSFLAMGSEADDLNAELQRQYREGLALDESIRLALKVLRRAAPAGAVSSRLEVAVLERRRARRAFRRLTDDEIASALEPAAGVPAGSITPGPGSSGSSPSDQGGTVPETSGPAGNGPAAGGSGGNGSGGTDASGRDGPGAAGG